MSKTDYIQLLIGLGFLFGAVPYTFSQRFFGRAPRWPLISGRCPMSPFSRWLLVSIFIGMGLDKIAVGLFHIDPSYVAGAIFILSLILLRAAYCHDRRLAHNNVT